MPTDDVSVCAADMEAIQHLKQAVGDGKHWYVALLEAIGLWGSVEEVFDGRHYRYLIDSEAFDWLLLAERLCAEAEDLLPDDEIVSLLFFAIPPIEISAEEFSNLIGGAKYRAYLNYLYGVVVEEALMAAVEEDVDKERNSLADRHDGLRQEAFCRVYGTDMTSLLNRFREGKGYTLGDSMTLTEEKEFVYWLFKYRVDHCDKERVASDTRKALDWLERHWASRTRRRPVRPLGVPPL